MSYTNEQTAAKLRRWEKYLMNFRLPKWEEIPDIGLYMEQVTALLRQYLDYMPPELKDEQFLTASTVNNYVRTKVMPEPVKKRYYRVHIAYLILILTLKQSLSIALIQKLIPMGLSEAQVKEIYNAYNARHQATALCFADQARKMAGRILGYEPTDMAAADTEELIAMSAIMAGFSRLLAEKLILLEGKNVEIAQGEVLTE